MKIKSSKKVAPIAFLNTLIQFAKTVRLKDLWVMETNGLSKTWKYLLRLTRIIVVAIQGFNENKVMLRASALTFYSIISIVPVVAMIFGIAKGFGFDDFLKSKIVENFEGQEEVANYILNFAQNFLEKSKGGVIAGIGVVMLFWAVMKVLSIIEGSFNDIWGIKKTRTWVRKFSDYFSIMLVAPIFIILAASMNVYIAYTINSLTSSIELFGYVAPVFKFFLRFTPYVLIWFLFTFLYIVMPNTKVKFGSGFVAGIIAGSLFQVIQWVYIDLQIGVSSYNGIYGSFAALPLLMVWMQSSWVVVLLGAELSFAHQNVEKIENETHTGKLSAHQRKILSLMIMKRLVERFRKGERPVKISELSADLNIPYRLLHEIMYVLIDCNVVSEVVTDVANDTAYQPALDINRITVVYVLERIQKSSGIDLSLADSPELEQINTILDSFSATLEQSENNKLLLDL